MSIRTSTRIAATIAAFTAAAFTFAAEARGPVATVDAFQQALEQGDEAAAKALLAPDVLIYESGGQEASREEYARHHLKADIAFLANARVKRLGRWDTGNADLALVTTRSRVGAEHKGKALDLLSTETMALRRTSEGWRIVHIHWSSRDYTP